MGANEEHVAELLIFQSLPDWATTKLASISVLRDRFGISQKIEFYTYDELKNTINFSRLINLNLDDGIFLFSKDI